MISHRLSTLAKFDRVIELKNGNKISGELLNKTDSTYSLKTEFGELVIPKKEISLVSDGSFTNNSKIVKKPSFLYSYLEAKQKQVSLNQQARWRIIYGTMLAGNILYGAGIPYLLDLDQTAGQYIGFRLLVTVLSFCIIGLQYRLWIGEGSRGHIHFLENKLQKEKKDNAEKK